MTATPAARCGAAAGGLAHFGVVAWGMADVTPRPHADDEGSAAAAPAPSGTDPALAQVLSAKVAAALGGGREAWTRRMFEAATALRAAGGGPVFDLSLGNPSLEPPALWRAAIRELLADEPPGQHRYMTNAGFPEVRAFVAAREAARFGLPITTDDVVMTVGAAGALAVLLRALVDPGEAVLVPAPYFAEYDAYAAYADAELRTVGSRPDFGLDVAAIEAALTADAAAGGAVRVLLLNSPNNPTGAVYDATELAALAAALERVSARRRAAGQLRPLVVLEDSPYRDLLHDGSAAPSLMPHWRSTIHVTSHSKDLGLAGERIGYLVVSPALEGRAAVARAAAYCNRVLGFVNAPALMQRALPRVLGQPGGSVDVGVYARHCATLAAALVELGFALQPPRAGFFLFPQIPVAWRERHGDQADVALATALLDARCVVVPGVAFGMPGHLRIAVCVDEATITGAVAALRAVVPHVA